MAIDDDGARKEVRPLAKTDGSPREHAIGNVGTQRKRHGKKIKPEIANFEQLLEFAYRQKGRKVIVQPAQEKLISQDLRLSDESLKKLHELAASDPLFVVPRQLLLLMRSLFAGSALRGKLRLFVRELLLSHPLLAEPDFDAAINNLDNAQSPPIVLGKILRATRSGLEGSPLSKLNDARFAELKIHVANCVALWIADMKSWAPSALADAMFHGIWKSEARNVSNDSARCRVLTEIDNPATLGVACEALVQLAEERSRSALASAQEAAGLKMQVDSLRRQVAEMTSKIGELEAIRQEERAALEGMVRQVSQSAADEATHLRDDFETLRTRILRTLRSDLDLLESGLEALRREPPKIAVMMDVAERVTDSMRSEIRNAQGES